LNGRWSLAQDGRGPTLEARVPGTVHQDLLREKRISDPYYRDEELNVQWIGDSRWEYSRVFEVPRDFSRAERVLLRCEGLDSLATITLDGRRLARTDNMYRTWEFDVTSRLKQGDNRIAIAFAPVLPYLNKLDQRRPRLYGWTSARLHHAGWLRKEPCNFGWDWGPKLLTCGIWRDISLLAIEGARLRDIRIRQQHEARRVACHVEVEVESAVEREFWVRLALSRNGRELARVEVPVSEGRARAVIEVKSPELWWPNGLGEQALYQLEAELFDSAGAALDSLRRRIGLRTMELSRKADRYGESFEFVVNGVPFFAKGANWIPADTFAPRVTAADYARLLRDARHANMNMLRVWGGGIYESDIFYDLCDELGLCVWQDFMFACGTYPAYDAEFMENVKQEAVDNVKRLSHHACMALYCGNNEIEQGLVADDWSPTTMSWRDYDKLFNQLLPEIVEELAPGVDYWPGSPHTPGSGRTDFNDPDRGDAHLWGVWHGKKPFEWYRECTHRFVSEFGFQSFPHPKTVRAYTTPGDRNITSRVMEHHQRSPIGNTTIISTMTEWFLMPKDFESTLWLSQIQQGMAMKVAVEHWRRNMPRSMGALYWQLNDCWPVASWSSIDSLGRFKALHYMARHFFANHLVSAVENASTGEVQIFVTNDARAPWRGTVNWLAATAAGKRLRAGTLKASVGRGKSVKVGTLELGHLIRAHSPYDVLVWLELEHGGELVAQNLVMFSRPKHLQLSDPQVQLKVRERASGFEVKLSARRAALWCWLDLSRTDARFSDNFFHLRPGRAVRIVVEPQRALSLAAFERQLAVRHLLTTHA